MAERSVSVRLSARVDQYVAAMKRAEAASKLPAQSLANMKKVGGQLQSVGGNLTRYVSLPLAAVGVAASKMSMDFEGAFANMVGLAGAPIGEIEALKESVLALSGDTGRAPMELADALYAAMSSGLDAAEAMDAVDIAAHGAAAGLGSSADIVSLVASATTSYGDANLSAAQAVDILTATIREGRADPDELAGSLGRILPVAAELGVSFDDVGAATAYLSNVFGDTNRTVTAMSGLLLKLMSPTQQGRKALADYGLTVEQLKASIDKDGLLGALELLRTSGLAGNSQALRAVFDDVEAFQGATALLGADVETLNGIFENVENSTGAMGEAFAVVAETDGFKMKQALAEIQVAMIQVGDVLLPIAAQIGSAIADLANWFTSLPGPVQEVAVAIGGLAAAGGPAIWMAGTLMKNWQQLSGVLSKTPNSVGTATKALGALGIVAGTAYAAWNILGEGHLNSVPDIDASADALIRATSAGFAESAAAGQASTEINSLAIAHKALSLAIAENADDELSNAFTTLNVAAEDTLGLLVDLRNEWLNNTSVMDGATTAGARLFAEFFGKSVEDGRSFMAMLRETDATTAQLAATFGVSEGSIETFVGALGTLETTAIEGQQEIAGLALAFLDSQVALGGAAREAVLAAQDIAGLRTEGTNAIGVYEEFVKIIGEMTPAERAAAGVTDEMADSLAGMSPEAVAAALGMEQAGDAATGMGEKVDASSIVVKSAAERMAESAEAFEDAWVSAIDEVVGDAMGLYDAEQAVWSSALGFEEAVHKTSRALDLSSEEGQQNADVIQEWAQNIADHTQGMIDSGATALDVANDYSHNRDALLDQAEAAGFDREAVDDLISSWGLMPDMILTTYNMSGITTAQEQIQTMIDELDEIPPEVATQVQTLIDQGLLDQAIAVLAGLANPIDVPVRPYLTKTMVYANGVVSSGGGKMVMQMAATGAFADQPVIAGEAGREGIYPFTRPREMDAMVADPRSAPLWASMARVWSPMGGGGGGSTSIVYELGGVAVTTPDQAQVATAVRRQVETVLFRASYGTARRR